MRTGLPDPVSISVAVDNILILVFEQWVIDWFQDIWQAVSLVQCNPASTIASASPEVAFGWEDCQALSWLASR